MRPLSAKKLMLAVLLADDYADALFAAQHEEHDILRFRERLAAESSDLALLFALAAMREDGPRLVTEAVEVPIENYNRLSVEDFMVSLYNDHTVQRVRVALPGGERRNAHEMLTNAVYALAGNHNEAPQAP